jgi:hypothetical protein
MPLCIISSHNYNMQDSVKAIRKNDSTRVIYNVCLTARINVVNREHTHIMNLFNCPLDTFFQRRSNGARHCCKLCDAKHMY